METFRLAILQSHPIQYFSPLYRRLAQKENIDLTVYYCSRQGVERYHDKELGIEVQWDTPLLDGYTYEFLPDISGDVASTFSDSLVHTAIFRKIVAGGYDALWIYSYKHPTFLLAIVAAKLSRTAILIRTDMHLKLARLHQRSVKNLVRKPILWVIYKLFNAALAIGTNNAAHYRALGMAEDKIFLVPFSVDNKLFMANNDWNSSTTEAVKSELGIPQGIPVILFVGKLVPNKQPQILLEAFYRLQQELNQPAALVFVGEGKLRVELERYCQDNNVRNTVFAGFVNQQQLNQYYAVADIFVLLSIQETWGLVLNEAMCARNAVIVSDAIGCAPDLVHPGQNGYVVPCGDIDALIYYLAMLISNPERRKQMGEYSLSIISQWGLEETVSGVEQALVHCRGIRSKQQPHTD